MQKRFLQKNLMIMKGKDLTNTLVGVLLRFRQEPIALMSYIKGMFNQVIVPKPDRDYLRFLWWPNGDVDMPLEEYRMKTHLFGATSSPAVANFALRKTLQDPQLNDQVKDSVKNFYVDDCLQSVSNVKDGIDLAQDLRSACSKGGFSLTKWISNNRRVLYSIPIEERAKEVKELNLEHDSLPVERALGVQWQVESDTFGFKIEIKDRPATRRGILSVASSIYDPLGFASAAILPARRIMQDLTRLKLGWDEEIPRVFKKKWFHWISDLPKLASLSVPRCYKPDGFERPSNTHLHHFCDASEVGYGTVSYLRLENEDGDKHCSFVMSKSRVAPMKQVTIPRLELTAAAVAVRVNNMIQKELDLTINHIFFWTDSTTVLKYISNESTRFNTFVSNRLSVIRDGSDVSQWRYIPTDLNPADDYSRGMSVEKFVANKTWLEGPEILKQPEYEWPTSTREVSLDPDDPEVKKRVVVNAITVCEETATLERLFRRYSDWYSLKRSVAWLLRLKKLLKLRVAQRPHLQQHSTKPEGPLTLKDLQDSENAILACVQRHHFAEVSTMKKGCQVKKSSSVYKLDPKIEDGILRVGGRLSEATIPVEAKYPVFLPKNSYVSELILQHSHHSTGHSGRNHMLSHLHQRYWIVGANSAARKIISRCVICRRQRGRVQSQKMANLPADRLKSNDPPFTRVGMDFFGPVEVKQGRSMVKRYGVVFTCLAVRAVHL